MIGLRSDTVTLPTADMRRYMLLAELGDDDRDGDPTTKKLERMVAACLGKEAALFFPSGVMANQASVRLLARSGTEVFIDADAHIATAEMGGVAEMTGAQLRLVAPSGSTMTAADLRAVMRLPAPHQIEPSLVIIENTHTGAGGVVVEPAEMAAIADVARAAKSHVHLDGARLWHASVASGHDLVEFAKHADTVMVDFSKALGAPIGAAVATTEARIPELWRIRKRFGGSMRQTGMLAAAAIYALERHIVRLADDHRTAQALAAQLSARQPNRARAPQTNIVLVDLPEGIDASRVASLAQARGVRVAPRTARQLRAVTHLGVSLADVMYAGDVLADAIDTEIVRAKQA